MKRKMILGTDWWTDCDDAVAVRILARENDYYRDAIDRLIG